MKVLVDTTIWSIALRRRRLALKPAEQRILAEWIRLVNEDQASLIGPIRQEVLSGIRRAADFERLQIILEAFEDVAIEASDYVQAADFFNTCRSRGLNGSPIDLLICAVAHRLKLPIFTTDGDFAALARHIPLSLHRLPDSAA